MSQKWVLWMGVFLCQACTEGSTGDAPDDMADAANPVLVEYKMYPAGPLEDFVEIVIDGEVRARHTQFLLREEYILATTRIESRHKATGNILSSADIQPVCASNLETGDFITTESQGFCVSPNGHISGLSDTCCEGSDNASGCFDTFCPECSPLWNSCSTDEHCALVLAHENPLVVHTTCLSQGTVAVGASCSFATAGPDAIDECVADSGCIGNVCRQFCDRADDDCEAGFTCTASELLASLSNLGVCLPSKP